jgi:RNA polymerase sigma-70 factor (ECF subfamily)
MVIKSQKIEYSSETDESIMTRMKNGDKQALGILVERYKKTAYHDAYGYVGNRDDAYDISQEAFIRVYRSANKFDTTLPFLPWFRTIIRNLSLTWLSKRSRYDDKSVELDDISFLLVDKKNNPEDKIIEDESKHALGKALMKLSFEDREIIVMQHFRGMSYDEIADALQIKKGTVMSRLYYARLKLAKIMGAFDE